MNAKLDIVFASDQGFVPQLLVASGSAVHAARGSGSVLSVHVLDCGIDDETWSIYSKKISALAKRSYVVSEIVRHRVDMGVFSDLPCWTNGSRAPWARILLPEILCDIECCVYSDCDVLFIDNPVGILDELDNSGKVIIGHLNPFADKVPDATWFSDNGLPYNPDNYFCSGLIGVNLEKMRNLQAVNAYKDFLRRFPIPSTLDQTFLNYVCGEDKGLLSNGWGLFTDECYATESAIKAIHFSGGWPWARTKNAYDALCISLSERAVDLWCSFQTEVLKEEKCRRPPTPQIYRLEAKAVLIICRLLNAIGLIPPRLHCITSLVKSFDGPGHAIGEAKKRLLQQIPQA